MLPQQILPPPAIANHLAERFPNGDAVRALVGPRPLVIDAKIPLLVIGRIIKKYGEHALGCAGRCRECQNKCQSATHGSHTPRTRAGYWVSLVVSTGLVRQLRNVWRNRRRLPIRSRRR